MRFLEFKTAGPTDDVRQTTFINLESIDSVTITKGESRIEIVLRSGKAFNIVDSLDEAKKKLSMIRISTNTLGADV